MRPLLQLLFEVLTNSKHFTRLPETCSSEDWFEYRNGDERFIFIFHIEEWTGRMRVDCLLKNPLPAESVNRAKRYLRFLNRKLMLGCVEYLEEEGSIMYSQFQNIDASVMIYDYLIQVLTEVMSLTVEYDDLVEDFLENWGAESSGEFPASVYGLGQPYSFSRN